MKLIIALALGAAAHAADDLKEVHGHGRRLGALDGTIYSLETTFDVAGGRKLTEQELETTFNEDNGAMANFFDVEVLQDLTIKNFDVHAAQTGIRVRVPVGPPQPALRLREDRLLRGQDDGRAHQGADAGPDAGPDAAAHADPDAL